VTGILFDIAQSHHQKVAIPTLVGEQVSIFPVLELILGDGQDIHECIVHLADEGNQVEYGFLATCQVGTGLRSNGAIKKDLRGKEWKGALVVLPLSAASQFVNLSQKDLGFKAIKQCILVSRGLTRPVANPRTTQIP
jgi:hypothetical protein